MRYARGISPRNSGHYGFEFNRCIKISAKMTSSPSAIVLRLSSKTRLELPWKYRWQTKGLCCGVTRKGLILINSCETSDFYSENSVFISRFQNFPYVNSVKKFIEIWYRQHSFKRFATTWKVPQFGIVLRKKFWRRKNCL